jgi:hypothetical protein
MVELFAFLVVLKVSSKFFKILPKKKLYIMRHTLKSQTLMGLNSEPKDPQLTKNSAKSAELNLTSRLCVACFVVKLSHPGASKQTLERSF